MVFSMHDREFFMRWIIRGWPRTDQTDVVIQFWSTITISESISNSSILVDFKICLCQPATCYSIPPTLIIPLLIATSLDSHANNASIDLKRLIERSAITVSERIFVTQAGVRVNRFAGSCNHPSC